MPTFAYKALDARGQAIAAELEAADRSTAVRELTAQGVNVTEINERRDGVARLLPGTGTARLRVGRKQLAYLTRQLAVSLDAGLPLISALNVMSHELDHAPSRELLQRLSEKVQHGAALSAALRDYPNVFQPMYVRLVEVGETGGMLETMLNQLADMLERQNELRERIQSASIYPAILLLVGILSVVIIVTAIVPRIIESLDAETFLLPWPTRVLMATSAFIGGYWWLLLILIVAAVIGWRRLILHGPGRRWWDTTLLRIPILGRLTRQSESARFARSLGILTSGGVTITEALNVVQDTVNNIILRDALHNLTESIRAGDSIARPLQRSGHFPPLLVQMVRVGENTGRLDEMLLRAAGVHESEARVTLDRLVNILPVLMILALACVIGFIVAGLVLAIVEFQTTGFGAVAG
jgi:type II secretory pathway component PulF